MGSACHDWLVPQCFNPVQAIFFFFFFVMINLISYLEISNKNRNCYCYYCYYCYYYYYLSYITTNYCSVIL